MPEQRSMKFEPVLWIVLTAALAACQQAQSQTEAPPARESSREQPADAAAVARMIDANGKQVGTVRFERVGQHVEVDARFSGLTIEPGFHGFHIHEVGRCEPRADDGPFTSAGGHHNPGDVVHHQHAGDLPPLMVTPQGTARLSFTTARFEIGELLAGDGSAVMLHAKRDNFAHIPDRYTARGGDEPGPDEETRKTGDAGDRSACGVVTADSGSGAPSTTN